MPTRCRHRTLANFHPLRPCRPLLPALLSVANFPRSTRVVRRMAAGHHPRRLRFRLARAHVKDRFKKTSWARGRTEAPRSPPMRPLPHPSCQDPHQLSCNLGRSIPFHPVRAQIMSQFTPWFPTASRPRCNTFQSSNTFPSALHRRRLVIRRWEVLPTNRR